MSDAAFGNMTGRVFIYDDRNTRLIPDLSARPDHDDWHEWTEYLGSDGEVTWVSSDPDGYWLDAEEFWGGTERDHWNQFIYRVVESPTSMIYATWEGPGTEPVYYGSMKRAVLLVGLKPLEIVTLVVWKQMTDPS